MTYSFILIEEKIKRKTKNLLRQGAISTVATKKKKKELCSAIKDQILANKMQYLAILKLGAYLKYRILTKDN